MKRQYRISPKGSGPSPTDAEIARYRDPKRLIYNYQKAVTRSKRPLYRDPKAFIILILIVLLALFLAEVSERQHDPQQPAPIGTEEPTN